MGKINVSQFDTRSGVRNKTLPVQVPIPGSKQVQNNTDGFVWKVSIWDQLERYIVIGAEGGTYYVGEHELMKQNHAALTECLAEDPARTIKLIQDISMQGRAYRNEPALFALAVAASSKDDKARKLALAAVASVCRIGTHLFHFAAYASALRGWGRGLRSAVASWYTNRDADTLAYQAVKYQQRDGWSHKDLLRLSHPVASDVKQDAVLRWMIGGMDGLGKRTVERVVGKVSTKLLPPKREKSDYPSRKKNLPEFIEAFEEAKTAGVKTLVNLIEKHNLPREAVPTDKLNSLEVWDALLQKMPLTAMIRNLAKMTAIGLIKPMSEAAKLVKTRLADKEYLRKSRIHPMQVLVAAKIYNQGHGDKGKLSWTAVPSINEALEAAFYATFPNVKSCGKPLLIALDVSGSMGSSVAGSTPLRACEVTAAMSLVHASVEDDYHIFGFANTFRDLGIRKGMTLENAMKKVVDENFGSTNVSLAIDYALKNQINVGGFLVMTDNEVNTGRHVSLALREYREKFVQDARLVVMATTATPFSVNDPSDKYGLDICGFDTSTPSVAADFIRGSQTVNEAVETED